MLDTLTQDLRFALRFTRRNVWSRATVVVVLALGLGVSATMLTIVYGMHFRSLPFAGASRIMAVRGEVNRQQGDRIPHSLFEAWRGTTRAFTSMAGYSGAVVTLSDERHPADQVAATFISHTGFALLGVRPMLGREFLPADEVVGAPAVVMLSHRLWTSRYDSRPSIIGTVVRVAGLPAVVVGVMPEGFTFPTAAQVWQPLSSMPAMSTDPPAERLVDVVGRLHVGYTRQQAREELAAIASTLDTLPDADRRRASSVIPLNESYVGRATDPAPLMILLASATVLLISCAHGANLLLVQSAARAGEMSLRTALGATRVRIVRQLLTETLLVALAAGAAGLAVASVGAQWFAQETSDFGLPYWTRFGVDGWLFGCVALVSVITGVAFGLAPALHLSRSQPGAIPTHIGGTTTRGRDARRLTGVLLVGQLALTVTLLATAGLLVRSARALHRVDHTIDVSNLWELRMSLPQPAYASKEQREQLYERLEDLLASGPVIGSATLASVAPFLSAPSIPVLMNADRLPDIARAPTAGVVAIGPRYFETLGLSLIRGASFDAAGAAASEGALVNERFVSVFSPDQDPLGRRVALSSTSEPDRSPQWLTIIGIAPPVRQGPARDQQPVVYVPFLTRAQATASIIIRGAPEHFAERLRQEVRRIDADLPLHGLQSLARLSEKSRWIQRISSTLFSVFAAVALVLSGLGLYAMTAHVVAQRTKEIAIRMAVGARTREISWLFLRRALVHLVIGLSLGLAGAVAAGTVVRGILVQTSPADPLTLAAVVLGLTVVTITATAAPARRAARADPMVTLRQD